jgi:hypothetical protein
MNLTLGDTFPRTWKRFGVQHVVAAAAAAVALTVALAAGLALTDGSGRGEPVGTAATSSSISAHGTRQAMTYYLVGSQEEATRIEEGVAIAAFEAGTQPGYQPASERLVPVIINTPEQETHFQAQLMAMQQSDSYWGSVRVVDLRR